MDDKYTQARRLEALRQRVGLASAQRTVGRVSRALLGRPLATSEELQQQVGKAQALPVLASDNVSSSAYATEELARVLVLAGAGALALTMPLAIGLVAVLAVVVLSYSQVIRAYPSGGGSYAASKENLGSLAGLVAAASLLVDYVLTVAVSVSAGVAAITSAAPDLFDYRVPISLIIIAALVVGNLRGVREASTVFSVPTYVYILLLASLIIFGLFRLFTGTMPEYQAPAEWVPVETQLLTFVLILRAFSSGAVALTGVEAVSNGVPMLRRPQARNANITLAWMAVIFSTLFLGISFLSAEVGLIPDPREQTTLVSQLAVLVAGNGWYHLIIQAATALILILAANTAFVGFPRLGSVLAADRWFPNQFLFRGRRLALATGIVGVGVVAALLVVMFQASVASLIPLYTVGVFVAFTLSQAGMVRYWQRTKGRWWKTAMALNGVGAVVTGVVAVEAITVKFSHGAWVVLVTIPLLVLAMMAIRRHYLQLARQLALGSPLPPLATVTRPHTVVVPVADINKAVLAALAYARSLSPLVQAVHVTDEMEETTQLRQRWDEWAKDIPLFILEAPYRDWTGPLLRYVEALSQEDQTGPVTVVVPEFVPSRWWEFLLHSQSAFRLKMALLSRPNVVVVDIPYHLRSRPGEPEG